MSHCSHRRKYLRIAWSICAGLCARSKENRKPDQSVDPREILMPRDKLNSCRMAERRDQRGGSRYFPHKNELRRPRSMLDIIFIAATISFFALGIVYVRRCERLKKERAYGCGGCGIVCGLGG